MALNARTGIHQLLAKARLRENLHPRILGAALAVSIPGRFQTETVPLIWFRIFIGRIIFCHDFGQLTKLSGDPK